jgi:hypothetical protein
MRPSPGQAVLNQSPVNSGQNSSFFKRLQVRDISTIDLSNESPLVYG